MVQNPNIPGAARTHRGAGSPPWMADLLAGLTIAAIAVPEQMATARLGHFPPQIGLIAFVAASLGFLLLGSSRIISVGADSTITPIFSAGLALSATTASPGYFQLAATLAILVGAIVAISGLCRMGWISSLLSVPVTSGFLAGISVHILSSQLPLFCGLTPISGDVLSRLADVLRNVHHASGYSVFLGCSVLIVIAATETLDRRWPGALIGVAAAVICTACFSLQSKGVQILGAVPPALPHLPQSWPTTGMAEQLAPLSILLAIVVMVQSAATRRALSSSGDPLDLDRDLVGIGLANIVAGLAGAFPVNASPPRSAIAAEAGARSKAAGLTACGAVALLAIFGAPLLGLVPNAALAAVLVFVAFRIVQFGLALEIWRQSKAEFALIVATAAAIVIFPIQVGVAIGILLSLLHGMWTVTRAQTIVLQRVCGTSVWWPASPDAPQDETRSVLVIAFQAPLSFLNADLFKRGAIGHVTHAPAALQLVVLEASSIVEIDFTAAHALSEVVSFCRDRGILFAMARLESVRAQNSFSRFGITDLVGNKHFYHSVYEAVEALAPVEARAE